MSLQDIYEAVKEGVINNHYNDDDFIFNEVFYMDRIMEAML